MNKLNYAEVPAEIYKHAFELADYFSKHNIKNWAINGIGPIAQQIAELPIAPVAWHLRIGASPDWSICNDESDADFYGKQSGLRYEKRPLYTAPPAAVMVTDDTVEGCPHYGTPHGHMPTEAHSKVVSDPMEAERIMDAAIAESSIPASTKLAALEQALQDSVGKVFSHGALIAIYAPRDRILAGHE